jgi:hypothetical protein
MTAATGLLARVGDGVAPSSARLAAVVAEGGLHVAAARGMGALLARHEQHLQ